MELFHWPQHEFSTAVTNIWKQEYPSIDEDVPVLKEQGFLDTKGDAMGTVSNLVTARERSAENQADLFTGSSRCKTELAFDGHAHSKSFS